MDQARAHEDIIVTAAEINDVNDVLLIK